MKKRGKYGGALLSMLVLLWMVCLPANGLTINLRVAYCCNMPPYQFEDKDGNCVGMHADILNRIAKENGFVLDYIPMNNYSDCIRALETGEADLVLGAMFDGHYEEQMSEELSSSTLCLLVRNDLLEAGTQLPDLSGEKAVFEYGTANYSLISNIGASMYVAVGNQSDVFQNHIDGKAEAIIGVKDSILWQIYEKNLEDEYSISNNYMSTIRYGILTQKGDNNLRRILNNGIMTLRTNGEYDEIYQRWTVSEPFHDAKALIRRSIYAVSAVVALWLIYALFSHRIQSMLKKQVEDKTCQLQKTNAELERRIIQIQNANDLQRCLIENSPNGMVLFEQDYRIRVMNHSACVLAGIDIATVPESFRLTEINFFQTILERMEVVLFDKEKKRIDRIISMAGAGGEVFTYQCNVLQAANTDGDSALLLTVSDITKEEQEKRQSFEKEKTKALSRLVAGIAHEIRNPLMSIRTFSTLITTRKGEQQVQDMFAEFVPAEVDRISMLIDGLLNYAKPAQREVVFVDVEQAINECMYLTQAVVQKGLIQTKVYVDTGLMIQADKNQIKQILINFILNGIESMEKKWNDQGERAKLPLLLTIVACESGDHVMITVEDQGCGMSEKEVRRCTDPFFTTKGTGTGLGLALSKSYIEENGGDLLIESKEREYTKITMKFVKSKMGGYKSETSSINYR